ncbi:hypothetical protein ACFE04_004565 [Oxalis oulophora]
MRLSFPMSIITNTNNISSSLYLTPIYNNSNRISVCRRLRRRPVNVRVLSSSSSSSSSSDNQTTTTTTTPLLSALEVVNCFYDGINARDLTAVNQLIAVDCVYEDLIFPTPFVGRKAIMDFFDKFIDTISKDLQFVIDDISTVDSSRVGVIWHLGILSEYGIYADWKGKPFPFSKGCSFYRLEVFDGQRQIVYGRDCVEPAIKPGEAALGVIKAVTWLLEKFPQIADKI